MWHIGRENQFERLKRDLLDILRFIGCLNACLVQPVITVERPVFYRERAAGGCLGFGWRNSCLVCNLLTCRASANDAGYYASGSYALGQLLIELPYLLFQACLYSLIVYAMVGYDWTPGKFFW